MSAQRNDPPGAAANARRPSPTPLRGVLRADLRPDARTGSTPPRRVATQPRFEPASSTATSSKKGWRALLLASVAGASAFGVVKVKDLVEHSDALPVRTVSVTGVDPASARAAEVKAWAELVPGEPFFGVDTDAVAARVEEHPFVRSAEVRRLPPDTIEIAIEERATRAVVRAEDGGLYLLDADGALMKRARPSDALDVPVLSLRDLKQTKRALSLLEALERRGLLGQVSELVEHAAVGFDVVFDDGALVRIGDTDFDSKLARYAAVVGQLRGSGSAVSFMWLDDARHPERVAVRLRPSTETSTGGG
jgi:cell division septal protein FtsQ